LQAVGPLPEHDMAFVHVDEVEPHARPLWHDLSPRSPARARDRRGHQPEVGRTIVGEDQETILLVVDRIFDIVPPRLNELRRLLRLVAAEKAALARHLARAGDEDEALALGELDVQLEALVVLLE